MAEEANIDTRRCAAVGGLAGRPFLEWQKDALIAILLAVPCLALYLLPALKNAPISQTPEVRIAIVAREMIESGEYVVPTIAGEKRLNKPPLPYWTTVAAARLLGADGHPTQAVMTRAVEVAAACATALSVLIVVLYGSLVFGRTAGIAAGLILAVMFMAVKFAWKGFGDPTLMAACAAMFCAASWLVCAPRPGIWSALALGVSLGLAVLAKGHIPLLLLAGPVVWSIFRREFDKRKALLLCIAIVAGLALAAPWFWVAKIQGGGGSMEYEMLNALDPTAHHQSDRWTYYLYKLAGGLVPWTALAFFAILFYFSDKRKQRDAAGETQQRATSHLRFFLIAFCVGFIGFVLIPKQQEHYLLPLLPVAALTLACILSRFDAPGGVAEEKLAWSQYALGLFIGAAVACMPLWPLEHLGKTSASAQQLHEAIVAVGWQAPVAGGLVLFLLFAYMARQFAEGRVLRGVALIAACAYAASLGWGYYVFSKPRDAEHLALTDPRLRTQIARVPAQAKIYGVRVDNLLATFYLERAVAGVSDLADEPLGQTGAAAPARVLIGARRDLEALKLAQYLPPAGGTELQVLTLPSAIDWPERFHDFKKNKSILNQPRE